MRIQSILFFFLAIILIVAVAEAKMKKLKANANRALVLAPPIRRDATGSKADCDATTGKCTPATDTCQESDCKCYDGTKFSVGKAWDSTKGKCVPSGAAGAASPGASSTTTAAPKKCKNKHAPGRKSDCPSVKYLCNNSIYRDLMTEQCPKTCKRGKCKGT